MNDDRIWPDTPTGPFPTPPESFVDADDRCIEVRGVETGADSTTDDAVEALVGMYLAFDSVDRAQGVPPVGESAVRDWLDSLISEHPTPDSGFNVVAFQNEAAVGHATLVPDGDGSYELAIFVHQDFRNAGIGTTVLELLLGYGEANGATRVWLTVERWNRSAIGVYERVGFETTGAQRFELEMSIRLA